MHLFPRQSQPIRLEVGLTSDLFQPNEHNKHLNQYVALPHRSLRNPYRLPVLPVSSLRIPPILLVKSLYS
jgi:hypothetical protein